MNLVISLLLLVASVANSVASFLLFRVMNKYFEGELTEERRQLRIVFGVFSSTVLIVMILSFAIGKLG